MNLDQIVADKLCLGTGLYHSVLKEGEVRAIHVVPDLIKARAINPEQRWPTCIVREQSTNFTVARLVRRVWWDGPSHLVEWFEPFLPFSWGKATIILTQAALHLYHDSMDYPIVQCDGKSKEEVLDTYRRLTLPEIE